LGVDIDRPKRPAVLLIPTIAINMQHDTDLLVLLELLCKNGNQNICIFGQGEIYLLVVPTLARANHGVVYGVPPKQAVVCIVTQKHTTI
jgi:uncharacterized protein (UPF0218 family)